MKKAFSFCFVDFLVDLLIFLPPSPFSRVVTTITPNVVLCLSISNGTSDLFRFSAFFFLEEED